MVIPGLYFLVKCCNENCIYYNKTLPLYIGSAGKFDIFHSIKIVKCGGCYLRIKSIISIFLAACVFSYRGMIKNEKKVTTESDKKVHRIEIFEHNNVNWEWLVIQIRPLQQHLVLENLEQREGNKNFSSIVEDLIIQFSLVSQASKYYKKIENLKSTVKSL